MQTPMTELSDLGVNKDTAGSRGSDARGVCPSSDMCPSMQTQVAERQCRICFEIEGGDLIAPCLCAGSMKWVHRRCLDHWRSDGSSAKKFTHCPNCNFAYKMVLISAADEPEQPRQHVRQRRRAFLQWSVANFCGFFCIIQFILGCIAIVIRTLDRKSALVKVLPLGHPLGMSPEDDGTFKMAVRYHKRTYYFAAVLFVLFLVGLFALRTDCAPLFRECSVRTVLLAVFILAVAVVIGFLVALVVLVAALQRAVTKYYQIQELQRLTREYVVEDLSSANLPPPLPASLEPRQNQTSGSAILLEGDMGAGEHGTWTHQPATNPGVRRSLSRDLQVVYGT